MKTIKGDLILKKDTEFDESIKVKGNIRGFWNLKVNGNIACLDIDCRNIIFCEAIKAKGRIRARALITGRIKLPMKEWKI